MSERKKPGEMTDDELLLAMREKYGPDWNVKEVSELDYDNPVFIELMNRAARGRSGVYRRF